MNYEVTQAAYRPGNLATESSLGVLERRILNSGLRNGDEKEQEEEKGCQTSMVTNLQI